MKKYCLLIAMIILSVLALHAQNLSVAVNYVTSDGTSNNNLIFYQQNQFLSWDDFKGKPVEGSEAAALTNAGFALKLAFHRAGNTSQLVIDVNCNFSKKDSWVKPGNKSAYILNHEQKHFDIAYLNTIFFIQKLKKATLTNANYAAVIQNLHNECAAAMEKMQNQYDIETRHSLLTEKQEEWDEKISKQLELALKE